MKNKILIIEDNYYKFFTMKQLLETQLRLEVETISAKNQDEIIEGAVELNPNVLICQADGGVIGLLEALQKRGVNRRNATVTIMVTPELDRRVFEGLKQELKKETSKSSLKFPTVAKAA